MTYRTYYTLKAISEVVTLALIGGSIEQFIEGAIFRQWHPWLWVGMAIILLANVLMCKLSEIYLNR